MYTSGTESRPKGVMHSSRSLMCATTSATIVAGSMAADDVEMHSLPLYHCAQLDNFLGHRRLPRVRPASSCRDPIRNWCCAASKRIGDQLLRPTDGLDRTAAVARSSTQVDLSSLRKGYYGASASRTEVLHEIRDRLPNLAPLEFLRADGDGAAGQARWGPTTSATTPARPADPRSTSKPPIVDDTDHPVRPGTVGEIVHRGPHLHARLPR